jgi:hypothetical protein
MIPPAGELNAVIPELLGFLADLLERQISPLTGK